MSSPAIKLTKAQRYRLQEARDTRPLELDGRSWAVAKSLERLGLVTLDARPGAWRDRLFITITDAGHALLNPAGLALLTREALRHEQ